MAVRSEIECAARRLGDGDRPDEKYGYLPSDSAAGGADGAVVPLGEYFTPLVSRGAVTDVLDTSLAVF